MNNCNKNGFLLFLFQQIHDKYEKPFHSARKRNLAITGGVTVSVIISPILAALTIGVGVPIALGYIYGVVPVSLCRSGGCATVTATKNGRGVNLDFEEDRPTFPGPSGFLFGASRSSSRGSMRTTTEKNGGMVTVVATVNNIGNVGGWTRGGEGCRECTPPLKECQVVVFSFIFSKYSQYFVFTRWCIPY